MEITYKFADGTTSIAEVNDEIGTFILDSRRSEDSADRKERYHCWSLDAIVYEGGEYGRRDEYPSEDDSAERKARVDKALSHLTETQQRRLRLRAKGLSLRDIADIEGVDVKTAEESVNAARKKFLKFFEKHPHKAPSQSPYAEEWLTALRKGG